MRMTVKEHRVSFWDDENILNINYSSGCTSVNALTTIDLYILNACITSYLNFISIKLLAKNHKTKNNLKIYFPQMTSKMKLKSLTSF